MGATASASALVLVLDPAAPPADRDRILSAAAELQPAPSIARGDGWAALTLGDGVRPLPTESLQELPGVRRVVEITAPYRLASREAFPEDGAVRLGNVPVGGGASIALAVGCSVDGWDDNRLGLAMDRFRQAGACMLHVGRLSVDARRGGVEQLRRAGDGARDAGLAVSVEVEAPAEIEQARDAADVLQVGSPNMQDFSLLRELGQADRPVLLKRGPGATVEEFLLAAEYVLSHGNGRVIMCESGIRTFDSGRNTRFEINAVPLLKMATHLPVMADPSFASPDPAFVPAIARAAVAAGADGVLVEARGAAGADGRGHRAIDLAALRQLRRDLDVVAGAVGRRP